jgi:hypothetical protein
MPPLPSRHPLALAPAFAVLLSLPGLAASLPGSETSATQLRQRAEAAAGRPVAIDPRLRIPACAGGFAFEPVAASLAVHCPETGWRLVVPLGGGAARTAARAPAAPVIRRGDTVRVVHAGPGFTIAVDAIAENAGAPGDRILLRNRLTGARFPATIGADGAASTLR